jgi:hypothetical protein
VNPLQRISAWLGEATAPTKYSVPQSILASPTVIRTYYLMGLDYESSSHSNAAWTDIPPESVEAFVKAFNDRARWWKRRQLWEPYVQTYARGNRRIVYIAGPVGYNNIGAFTCTHVESKIRPQKETRAHITPNNGITFTDALMELTVEGLVDAQPLFAPFVTITPRGQIVVKEQE